MKKHLSTILLIMVFLAGLSLLLYPLISNWWNSRVQTRAVADYKEAVGALSEQDYSEMFAEAEDYNARLRQQGERAFRNPSLIEGYEEALNIAGNGIMGYITIEKLDVELPIYHGTDPEVLQIAAGHLEGSSLPTGGKGNHCVISAHRGLPSSRLFTDLDEMEEGDLFTISVLNRQLTYQVDQILVVEPYEIEDLQITEDKDYCTLMTCTPYGINSQRLLVRGIRTTNSQGLTADSITADARQVKTAAVGAAAFTPAIIVILFCIYKGSRESRKRR